MRSETLRSLGVNISDINASVLLDEDFDGSKYGLSRKECHIVDVLRTFVAEYRKDMLRILPNPVKSSIDAVKLVGEHLRPLDHEELWVAFLNNASIPVEVKMFTSGTFSNTLIDTKSIIRQALIKKASGIILFHNHPSGLPEPGVEDVKATEKLRTAAQVFDVNVIDHIIVSAGKWYSFADNGCHKFSEIMTAIN